MVISTTTRFSQIPQLSLPFTKPRTQKFVKPPLKPRSQILICCLSIEYPDKKTSTRSNGSGPLRIVFAAGGTGCQIYPAVAIADEIKITNPDAQILFIGTESGLESTSVPSEGFLHSMDLAYAAADLVVSRAGAMTCSELLATGKPSILIPSPNVEEGHQFRNASLMADLAGSRIITEEELDSTTLRVAIEDILDNELLMTVMSERALQAAKPNAGAEIAEHIISLINSSPAKNRKAD